LKAERDLQAREAFLMISLTWLGIALVGAVSFVLAGNGALGIPVNALFKGTFGVTTTDFNLWSAAAKHLLFVCMFVGGMAGSTTCSIKTLRWLVVVKAFWRDLYTSATLSVIRGQRHVASSPRRRRLREAPCTGCGW
jgi:Trk-type K+ transport system membrane component